MLPLPNYYDPDLDCPACNLDGHQCECKPIPLPEWNRLERMRATIAMASRIARNPWDHTLADSPRLFRVCWRLNAKLELFAQQWCDLPLSRVPVILLTPAETLQYLP